MLTDSENKVLISNTKLVNFAKTPPKPSQKSDSSYKENFTQETVQKKDENEDKLKKFEEELTKNKEKLKEKTIKESKLLGFSSFSLILMYFLVFLMFF